ncbi:cytochrome c biogenesis protein ResB [Chromobacterium haemolyticum]|nr:cytochrome c biogenesis protein ResB [Chromobacterium haemolyticum]
MLAAKKGAAGKLGYFFAHIALVVICIGGLLDGNLPLKIGELTGKVVPETRDVPQNQIPAVSRLGPNNLSFRGNVTIAENKSADVTFLNAGNGYLVQELPFIITLKKFHVDYYSNGMPKLFASDIVVTDKASGKTTEATVKVNHPLIVDGIASTSPASATAPPRSSSRPGTWPRRRRVPPRFRRCRCPANP